MVAQKLSDEIIVVAPTRDVRLHSKSKADGDSEACIVTSKILYMYSHLLLCERPSDTDRSGIVVVKTPWRWWLLCVPLGVRSWTLPAICDLFSETSTMITMG